MHCQKKLKDAFAILPMRWVVERTFAWLGHYRRLSNDYEILKLSAENMVRIAMLRIMVAKCVRLFSQTASEKWLHQVPRPVSQQKAAPNRRRAPA
jgi:putative transposase